MAGKTRAILTAIIAICFFMIVAATAIATMSVLDKAYWWALANVVLTAIWAIVFAVAVKTANQFRCRDFFIER